MNIKNNKKPTLESLEILKDFESENNFSLPKDYQNFLIEVNGGWPEDNIFFKDGQQFSDVNTFFSINRHPEWNYLFYNLHIYSERIPYSMLPIANDSFGNLYLISLRDGYFGEIYFWKHEEELLEGDASEYFENVIFLAKSFGDFCRNLRMV